MEHFTDDQFTQLSRWAERERAMRRLALRGELDEQVLELMHDFSDARLSENLVVSVLAR